MLGRLTTMNKYRVVCSQLVYHETFIEAESEDEACQIAFESGDLDWIEFQYGDWEIEDVELKSEAITNE